MYPDEIIIRGAKEHNLKNIDVILPRFKLVVITGVSGSGKSSLVAQTLHPALARVLHRATQKAGEHDRIEGLEQANKKRSIDQVISITQDPIGHTPRSNPATYVQIGNAGGGGAGEGELYGAVFEADTLAYSYGSE